MSIFVNVNGTGSWLGHSTNIENFTVTESSTPIDPDDTSGATGSFDFSVDEDATNNNTLFLLNSDVELIDTLQGRIPGNVSGVRSSNGRTRISAESRLNLLHARVKALPFTGTLSGAFTYYLGLVGITTNLTVDTTIASTPVTFQGWNGDLWLALKQICSSLQVEIALVSGIIIMRPIRTRIADIQNISDQEWAVANNNLAQFVEVAYYNNQYKSNGLIYPVDIFDDANVIQQGAGETRVYQLAIRSTPSGLLKPIAQDSVSKSYAGPLSVYSIIDREENPVPAAWWTANGGNVSLSLSDDYSKIYATISTPIGMNGPYSFAGVELLGDAKTKFNTLRIMGEGVFYNREVITVPTGAPLARTAQTIGATVDNPAVSTLGDAYSSALRAAGKYASADQTISLSATAINRRGDNGQIKYPTFADFNTANVGRTFSQFNTIWTGKTFSDFTAFYYAQVADTFVNQAFGNSAGARVLYRDAYYRIRSASVNVMGVELEAQRDTIFGDFNTRWAGGTFASFNTRWAGKTFEDLSVAPLWA